MKTEIKLTLIAILISSIAGCVIINPANAPREITQNEKGNKLQEQDFELTLARFPNTQEINEATSLHLSVINYRQKLVADIDLLREISDSINIKIEIKDFDKTLIRTIPVTFSTSLIDRLNFEKKDSSYYQIKASNDTIRSCTIKNVLIQSDKSEQIYSYSGQLINTNGSEVSFWAQTDPVATKIIFGAVILASNFMDKIKWKFDLCNSKIEDSLKAAHCKGQPTVYVSYYTKPLAEIFYGSLWKDFYLDCDIIRVKCPSK